MQTPLLNDAVQHLGVIKPIHDYEPVNGLSFATNREALVR